jgi:hypothetical protein
MSDEELESSSLNAIARNSFKQPGRDQSDQVCRKYLFEGKCETQNCRYIHVWKKMMEERARIIKEWGGIPGPSFEGVTDYKKIDDHSMGYRRGAPGRDQNRVRLIDALVDEEEQEEQEMESSQNDCNLVASLMATGHTSKTWKAAHRVASVFTEDGRSLRHPVVVLFDSGASGSNYVSEAFISKMGLNGLVVHSHGSCRIANGEEVPLMGSVLLKVSFSLDDGSVCEEFCKFEILRGLREELILGVPDILSKFKLVFLEIVMNASSDLSFIGALNEADAEVRKPWSTGHESDDEEDLIPDPELSLNFLEFPYEEAFRQYLEELPSRISVEFMEAMFEGTYRYFVSLSNSFLYASSNP